ncbi:MAG: hypothetical protein QXQ81_01590, partial [Candidatus Thorarchaeota archaeon]
IRSIHVVDIDSAFPNDEVVINTDEAGIVISRGDVWQVLWTLHLNTTEAKTLFFGDINTDTREDMGVLLGRHVMVIDLYTRDLLASHVLSEQALGVFMGNFDGGIGLELLLYTFSDVYCVIRTASIRGQSVPHPMSVFLAGVATAVTTLAVALPLAALAMAFVTAARRRRVQ